MIKRFRATLLPAVLLVVGFIFWFGARNGIAADPSADPSGKQAQPSGSTAGGIQPGAWEEVKKLIKEGRYEEALVSLDALAAASPEDVHVQLYRSLCQTRLKSKQVFEGLSSEDYETLQQRLNTEVKEQKRSAAIQKSVDKQIQKEQASWDKALNTLQKQADQQAEQARKQAQAEAVQRIREEKTLAKEKARQKALERAAEHKAEKEVKTAAEQPTQQVQAVSAPAPQATPSQEAPSSIISAPASAPVSGPETPAPQIPSQAAPSQGGVELAPVTVSTPPGLAPATSPSLVGRTMPVKGVVQINANQMSVSPDRKIAIAEGDVEVVYENTVLICDRLTLFTDTKDAYAEGNVRIEEGKQVFRGEMVHYNFDTKKGRFLQGTVSMPPWHEHGRSVEHIAEGVYEVSPGYLTSCELEPPHFKFYGQRAIFFADDRLARIRNAVFMVDKAPFIYLPFVTFAETQSPFFIIPGKRKPWEEFVLLGYRYDLPIPGNHTGAVKLDWRRAFLWGYGLDHQFGSPELGKGLIKLYYNQHANIRSKKSSLPKGAAHDRYRILLRHHWQPTEDTSIVTDIQKYSDENYRKDFLFKEEYVGDDLPESFISFVRNDPNYALTAVARKRMNHFQTVTDTLPQVTFDLRPQQVGDTWLFSETKLDATSFQTKPKYSDADIDAVRVDWFQRLRYALNWFRPVEITPKAAIEQTYYNKDRQGSDREGDRHIVSGQWSTGGDASLKLFKIFPVKTNFLGLNINDLRHVLTPTVAYDLIHRPTVENSLLGFPAASGPANRLTFGLENKLQTRRPDGNGKLQKVDLARLLVSVPYSFRNNGNKQGGRLEQWDTDLELYPASWMRLEADWKFNAILPPLADTRNSKFDLDLVLVGGGGHPTARYAPKVESPQPQGFETGPQTVSSLLVPRGQWYMGLGHRYSPNDKTEDVLELDWRPSDKWEIGTFNRYTWKEVAGGHKRFNNLREYQYTLRRDLHDWIGQLVYRVDREFGEEIYLTMTLKAYPSLPIEMSESYHQPKIGSQSSPFSPIRTSS